MKPKHITVTLTRAEAESLWTAASQTLNHDDAMKATFANVSRRFAAYRAADKIQSALHPGAVYEEIPDAPKGAFASFP